MFYGVELHPPKLFWDLFCSKQCCEEVHKDEAPELFVTAAQFKERTGVDIHPAQSRYYCCFNCETPLELGPMYELTKEDLLLSPEVAKWIARIDFIGLERTVFVNYDTKEYTVNLRIPHGVRGTCTSTDLVHAFSSAASRIPVDWHSIDRRITEKEWAAMSHL